MGGAGIRQARESMNIVIGGHEIDTNVGSIRRLEIREPQHALFADGDDRRKARCFVRVAMKAAGREDGLRGGVEAWRCVGCDYSSAPGDGGRKGFVHRPVDEGHQA